MLYREISRMGGMSPVILWAECKCFGENGITWVNSETLYLPSGAFVSLRCLMQSHGKPSIVVFQHPWSRGTAYGLLRLYQH
jgi:hypothetical protein